VERAGLAGVFSPAECAIAGSMRHWRPDLVVPCDDTAVWVLHELHGRMLEFSAVIERSLGDPLGFAEVGSRVGFLAAMAETPDVPIPEWALLRQPGDLATLLQACEFPLSIEA
jgi:hypothetical protein